jgi:hypothetical protein
VLITKISYGRKLKRLDKNKHDEETVDRMIIDDGRS